MARQGWQVCRRHHGLAYTLRPRRSRVRDLSRWGRTLTRRENRTGFRSAARSRRGSGGRNGTAAATPGRPIFLGPGLDTKLVVHRRDAGSVADDTDDRVLLEPGVDLAAQGHPAVLDRHADLFGLTLGAALQRFFDHLAHRRGFHLFRPHDDLVPHAFDAVETPDDPRRVFALPQVLHFSFERYPAIRDVRTDALIRYERIPFEGAANCPGNLGVRLPRASGEVHGDVVCDVENAGDSVRGVGGRMLLGEVVQRAGQSHDSLVDLDANFGRTDSRVPPQLAHHVLLDLEIRLLECFDHGFLLSAHAPRARARCGSSRFAYRIRSFSTPRRRAGRFTRAAPAGPGRLPRGKPRK